MSKMNKIEAEKKIFREWMGVPGRRLSDQEVHSGPSDRGGVASLARIVFPGEDIADPAYLTWLYDHNPNGRAIELVTKSGDAITGHCAGVPLKYKIGAVVRPGCLAVNGMTHPDFRGRGIFGQLYGEITRRSANLGMDLTFGYPNSNSLQTCLRNLSYHDLGELPIWIRVFDLSGALAARELKPGIFGRALARFGNPILHLAALLFRPRRRKRPMTIDKIREFGPEFDSFWNTAKNSYAHWLVRDSSFLNWRYIQCPTRHYEIWAARSNGRLVGFLVGRATDVGGVPWGMIVELLALNSAEGTSAAGQLVGAFCRDAHSKGAVVAGSLMLKSDRASRALRQNGFIPCPKFLLPRRFKALVSWNNSIPAPEMLFNLSTWHMTLGDYDAA